ncbi:hypothetical protein NA57DRAFT_75603 [Rhizodiscina lignyota]|uniref:SGNH hydrolase-type esterase domain-containing protein n=1 Tax=Rhizodiscina lignyota TaxID=1504668 RepID=A0A9P4IE11_9PEZI|nr:hypothetical protein NA57DRAFT_75603 [Rhizodiscina lignyota]
MLIWPSISQLLLQLTLVAVAIADSPGSRALSAAQNLQQYYDTSTGLWHTTAWWTSANCLQALTDLQTVCPSCATKPTVQDVIATTHKQAQVAGYTGFIGTYYDDEAWWALAWVRAYDLTKNQQYLDTATAIFEDMLSTGMNATCGGIWWRKKEPKKHTAIANALFISLAAHLANRHPNKSFYYGWATKNYKWFQKVGYLKNCQIQDSLNVPNSCDLIGQFWTYNQGVILGAILEMNKFAADSSLIAEAHCIADHAISRFSDRNGILHELWDNNTSRYPFPVGHDGITFKGVFMRNLGLLQKETGAPSYKDFIDRNANSIWTNAMYPNGTIGVNWAGPLNGIAMAAQQAAGLDALVAAVRANPGATTIPAVHSPGAAQLSHASSATEPVSPNISQAPSKTASVVYPTLAKAPLLSESLLSDSAGGKKEVTDSSVPASASKPVTTSKPILTYEPTSSSTSVSSKAVSSSLPEYPSSRGAFAGMRLRICPIGDSITRGYTSTDGNGYREHLRQMLLSAGAQVNMVGSVRSGTMFDGLHDGHSGAVITQIQANVSEHKTLLTFKPNIVLLHAGTNDFALHPGAVYDPTHAPAHLQSLINWILTQVPEVVILVAQIEEVYGNITRTQMHRIFNKGVVDVVTKLAKNGKHIYPANSGPWLTATSTDKHLYWHDGLHPNDAGYEVLAKGWYEALLKVKDIKGLIQKPADVNFDPGIFNPAHTPKSYAANSVVSHLTPTPAVAKTSSDLASHPISPVTSEGVSLRPSILSSIEYGGHLPSGAPTEAESSPPSTSSGIKQSYSSLESSSMSSADSVLRVTTTTNVVVTKSGASTTVPHKMVWETNYVYATVTEWVTVGSSLKNSNANMGHRVQEKENVAEHPQSTVYSRSANWPSLPTNLGNWTYFRAYGAIMKRWLLDDDDASDVDEAS